MWRLWLGSGLVLAVLALFLAGLLVFKSALAQARNQGYTAGAVEVRAAIDAEIKAQRARTDTALAESNRRVAQLSAERDKMQDDLDVFDQRLDHAAGNVSGKCLDAGVVRALDRIGRGTGGSGAGP
jgi:septal ring factor EnvC (AmiA/AmiB activator)